MCELGRQSEGTERRLFCMLTQETGAMVTSYSCQIDFLACSSDASAPVIAFVSKIFAVDVSALPNNQPKYVSLFLYAFHCCKITVQTVDCIMQTSHYEGDFGPKRECETEGT